MLKTIHKYQKSILVYILIFILAASMLLFGVDVLAPRQERYAIKVDDTEITYAAFAEERRAMENVFRQRFGDLYNQLMETQGFNISQQVVDKIVPDVLLERTARDFGLHVSNEELRSYINDTFQGNYANYLKQTGRSAKNFEAQLSKEFVRLQLSKLLNDVSLASEAEAKAIFSRDETEYSVVSVEFNPTDFEKDIADPTDDELLEYFEENADSYEIPERVAYSFTVFRPADYTSVVEVADEDLEFYYSENQQEFVEPEQALVRHIQLNFPENASTEDILKRKELAEELLGKVQAGEDLAALALEHSDDFISKTLGGEIGWVKPGDKEGDLDKKIFALGGPGFAELVEMDYGYHVVEVQDYQEKRQKEYEEVKNEIEQQIRDQEAPAFAAAIAQERFEIWFEGESSLADFAKENKLDVQTVPLSVAGSAPIEGVPADLTAQVLEFPDEVKRLIDIGEESILVEVTEYKEPEIPELKDVREKVITALKKERALEAARVKAEELLAKGSLGELKEKTSEAQVVKRAKLGEGLLRYPPATNAIFDMQTAPGLVPEVVEYAGKFYIVEVQNISAPAAKDFDESEEKYKERATSQNTQALTTSIINSLKAKAEIDIDPGLVGES